MNAPVRRGLLRALVLAAVATGMVAAAASLSPIRWDLKTIGRVVPTVPEGLDLSDREVLFVSPDDGWRSAHVASYGLDFLTFPEGRSRWLVFSEGVTATGHRPDYVIDSTGSIGRWESGAWRPVDEATRRDLAGRLVLAASKATRSRLVDRWPAGGSQSEPVRVVDPAPAPSFWASPAWRVSGGQLARVFLALLLPVSALTWVVGRRRTPERPRWLVAALIVPVTVVGHAVLVYGLGFLTQHSMAVAIGFEVVLACGVAIAAGREANPRSFAPEPSVDAGEALRVAAPWALGGVVFLVVVVFRLDFDGDLYTHWIPSARMYHLHGHHDPAVLAERYGAAHEATYPPAFPIAIATLMWIAGMSGEASFAPGEAAHLGILLYRASIAVLLISLLAAVGATFRLIRDESPVWSIPVVAIPLALPLFLGAPRAGEVFFTPLLGFASLLLLAGGALRQDRYVRLGLAMAAFGLLVKNDALLVVPFVVLPWYLAFERHRGRGARFLLGDLVVGLAAVLPALVWRIDLAAGVSRTNFMFEDVGIVALASRLDEWPPLLMNAVEIVLQSGDWAILVVALPAVALFRVLVGGERRELVVPIGIAIYSVGISYIFVFSRSDPLQHMNLAYSRLLSHAVLSAILYASWGVLARVEQRESTATIPSCAGRLSRQ